MSMENDWSKGYIRDLNQTGWRFVEVGSNNTVVSPKIASYYDVQTEEYFGEWLASQKPVELSIVAVMPNGEFGKLPARALSYAATALSFADAIRRNGINVDTLRVISPCRINVFCNGGNEDQQLENAHRYRDLVVSYKNNYFPQLPLNYVTLDTGIELDTDRISTLVAKSEELGRNHPDVAEVLLKAAVKHDRNGFEHEVDQSLRPLIYLFAHPEAWGYSDGEHIFARNGSYRINYMPGSELRYLAMMGKIQDLWIPAEGKEIATVISARQKTAPYYGDRRTTEPTLSDLSVKTVEELIDPIRRQSGNIKIAEVIDNLNIIKLQQEQAARDAKRNKASAPIPISSLVKSVIN